MKSLLYAASLTFLAACLAGCKPEEPQEPQEPQEPEKPVLESLSFEQTELELNVGDVHLLEVIASPSDAEGYTLQWESSDEAVASVSDDGEVTALSAGTADITYCLARKCYEQRNQMVFRGFRDSYSGRERIGYCSFIGRDRDYRYHGRWKQDGFMYAYSQPEDQRT